MSLRLRARPWLEALEDRALPALVTWVNPLGGDWDKPSNWSAGRVPNFFDDVVIKLPGVVVTHANSGTDWVHSLTSTQPLVISQGTLRLWGPSTVGALTLSGPASLRSEDTLLVKGPFLWTGGDLGSSHGEIDVLGQLTINGTGLKLGGDLNNAGQVIWSGGNVQAGSHATFKNLPGATFTVATNSTWFVPFENEGTFQVSPGIAAKFQDLENSGTVTLGDQLLTVDSYTQTASGTLRIAIDTPPALTVPLLDVSGTATLKGSLQVDFGSSVTPQVGDQFALLTYGSRSGSFASVSASINDSGTVDAKVVTRNGVLSLAVIASTPAPRPPAPPPPPPPPPPLPPVANTGSTSTGTTPTPTTVLQDVVNTGSTTPLNGAGGTGTGAGAGPVAGPGTGKGTGTNGGNRPAGVGGVVGGDGASSGNSAPSSVVKSGDADAVRGSILNGLVSASVALTGGGGTHSEGTSVLAVPVALPGQILAKGGSGGERGGSGRDGLTGLGEDLLEAFTLRIPEITGASEEELLSPNDLIASLLVGGRARADILPQRGSQLAPVATLLSDTSDADAPERLRVNEGALQDLLMGSLSFAPASRTAPAEPSAPSGPAEPSASSAPEAPPAEGGWRTVLLAMSALLGVMAQGAAERERKREVACRG